MKHRFSYLLPVALGLAGAIYAAVTTDYDHHADFAKYHTYSWIGVRAGNSLWQERIQSAVDSALSAHGWQRTDSGGDAGVSAFGRTREQDTIETFYDGFPGWGWRAAWWGGGVGVATTQVVPQRVGDLTVDVFDGGTKQLIWRGEASESISSHNPDKNDKKLDHTVDDMFKHFPPRAKG